MLRLLLLALLAAGLTGCASFAKLKKDLTVYNASVAEISGQVASPTCPACVTILVVVGEERKPLSYIVFERPGEFRFLASTGAKGVFAFHDTNGNLEYDPSEPFAWQALPDAVRTGKPAGSLLLDIQPDTGTNLAASVSPRGNLLDLRSKLLAGIDIQLGSVTDLSQPRFDPDFAGLGMWEPMQFMKSGLAGIYFLEPYSRRKTPILFVHGINGTPRDFAPLIARIDRDRYQPWLLYYPSGLEIAPVGNALLGMLNELWLEYGFKDLHIVAHSMGGLVSRAFLDTCRKEDECDYVRTFTSISSPFGGARAAQSGIEYAPVVMPVWRSMAPDSAFLQELFSQPLPNGVQHHMLFGYHNTSTLAKESGDGTIPLESQLRLAAQRQAVSLHGIDEDHVGILASEQTAAYVKAIVSGKADLPPK